MSVTNSDGSALADWLTYEDVSETVSGTPNVNSSDVQVLITATDQKGGYAY